MADIKVRIELNENAESEKTNNIISDNLTFANTSIQPTSNGDFKGLLKRENSNKGVNALTFGQDLYFNDNGMLDNVDNYGGVLDSEESKFEIVWGIVNSDNTYNVKITFENAENLKDIVVYGDKESQQFPTRAILDGSTEVFSDDYIWTLQFPSESATHTIEFTHWNRANYNAVLTFIGVMVKYIEIDKTNGLKFVESLSQSTGQPSEIFYGVVPNSGNIEIIDIYGELSDMVKGGILQNSSVPVSIFFNNKTIQHHITTDTSASINSKNLNINISNKLSNWDNIIYNGKRLGLTQTNAYNLLSDVFSYIGVFDIDSMLTETIVYGTGNTIGTVKDYLQSIQILFPFLEKSTFREAIDKFCTLAQLNVFCDNNDNITFVSARPICAESMCSDPIQIVKKNIIGSLDIPLFLKNKVSNVQKKHKKVYASQTSITVDKNVQVLKEAFYDPYVEKVENFNTTFTEYGSKSYNRGTSDDLIFNYAYFSFEKDLSNILNIQDPKFSATSSSSKVFESGQQLQVQGRSYDYPTPTDEEKCIIVENINSESEFISYCQNYDNSITNTNIENARFIIVGVSSIYKTEDKLKIFIRFPYKITNLLETVISGIRKYNTEYITTLNLNVYYDELIMEDFVQGDGFSSLYNDNELIQEFTNVGGSAISDVICQNILSDYNKGVGVGTAKVICSDYFTVQGNKKVNWKNGEIIRVGDYIQFTDIDSRIWKVTGARPVKTGVPLIELEFQEVVKTY